MVTLATLATPIRINDLAEPLNKTALVTGQGGQG